MCFIALSLLERNAREAGATRCSAFSRVQKQAYHHAPGPEQRRATLLQKGRLPLLLDEQMYRVVMSYRSGDTLEEGSTVIRRRVPSSTRLRERT